MWPREEETALSPKQAHSSCGVDRPKKKKNKQIENYEKRNEIAGSLCLGGWHDTVESPTL